MGIGKTQKISGIELGYNETYSTSQAAASVKLYEVSVPSSSRLDISVTYAYADSTHKIVAEIFNSNPKLNYSTPIWSGTRSTAVTSFDLSALLGSVGATYATTYWLRLTYVAEGTTGNQVATGVGLQLSCVSNAPSVDAPANDSFSSPTTISGVSGSKVGSNTGATLQSSEVMPRAQNSSTGSVWYKWTAPSSGTATFDTIGSEFDTVLGIYTGTSVSALTEIDSNDDIESGNTKSRVTFTANSGTTYRIAVYGYNGKNGSFTLNWSLASGGGAGGNTKYALCVGLNDYDMTSWHSEGWSLSVLNGCVNDATYFRNNLVNRGGWSSANVTKLTDSGATKAAIRKAITNYAAKAVSGDTFIFQHSSHGLSDPDTSGNYTKDVALAAYAGPYWDFELASDLGKFASGVKVVVVVDTCHSGGLFKGMEKIDANGLSFDIASRVSALIDNQRDNEAKSGNKAATKGILSSEIGWATAAEYDKVSSDGACYDSMAWMTDWSKNWFNCGGDVCGGAFTAALTWGWWTGTADVNGNGAMDVYEGFSYAETVLANIGKNPPKCLNEGVLRSVALGANGGYPTSPTMIINDYAANGNTSSITLSWSGAQNATSFNIYRSTTASPRPSSPYKTGATSPYTDSASLIQGRRYYYWIEAKNSSGSAFSAPDWGNTIIPLSTVLDNSTLSFTTGGDASWWGQSDVSHDGTDSARTGMIGNSKDSWLQTTVSGAGTLAFWWKSSCEDDNGWYDYLEVLVDGTQKQRIKGETDWTQVSLSITGSGNHTIKWNYHKDDTNYDGSDCGWVDQVTWTASTSATRPVNDNFADATLISGTSGSMTGSNVGATYETGEPLKNYKAAATNTIWWAWTASSSGEVTFNTTNTTFDTVMGIYTGTTVSSLTVIAQDDDGGPNNTSACTFTATSGTTYYIVVSGYGSSKQGTIRLNWNQTVASSFGPIWTIDANGKLTAVDLNGCEDVIIPNGVTSIGDSVFRNCNGLRSVIISSGVTNIGNWAFENCSGLLSVTIPSSVTSIGCGAFSFCNSLTSVYISDLAAWCRIAFPNAFDNPLYYAHKLYIAGSLATKLLIPDSVTNIGKYAFYNCSCITEVSGGNNVSTIGPFAFSGCTGLTNVVIPQTVTSIGEHAFYDCSGLVTMMFNGNAPIVGNDCFESVNASCVAYVRPNSSGWGVSIPGTWNNLRIQYSNSAASSYCLMYALNDGMHGVTHPTNATYNTAFKVSAPSRIGFTFIGWSVTSGLNTSTAKYGTSSSSQTTSITNTTQKCLNGATGDVWFLNLTSTVNGSVTLTANWTAKTYSVTLDSQGGNGGTTGVTATYGSSMPSITKPTRDGYMFGGYYSSTGGNGTQYYNAAGVSARTWNIANTTKLYAYWIATVPLPTVLDNTSLNFTTGGSAYWVGITNQFYYGGSSAQSGAITHSQSTWMQTTVSGPGTLSFWYKVSSESVCDKLIFYIDGTNRLTKSGTSISSWQQFTCVVSNNTQHVCKWTYSKDGSISSGSDCCWIDKVEWTPTIYNVECHNLYSDDGGMLYYHYITNGNWRIPGIETFTGGMFAGRNWSMRTGYAFAGWATNENGNVIYNDQQVLSLVADMVLYTQWTPIIYNMTYSLDGGTHGAMHPSTATYDTVFYVSAPTKSGYTFTGWTVTSGLNTDTAKWGATSSTSTSLTSTTTKCVNGATGSVYFENLRSTTGSVTLKANWTCNHSSTSIQNAHAATCIAAGYTGDVVCGNCGAVVETGTSIPALGHQEGAGIVTQEPTTTADGVMTYYCARCGIVMRTEAIPKLATTCPDLRFATFRDWDFGYAMFTITNSEGDSVFSSAPVRLFECNKQFGIVYGYANTGDASISNVIVATRYEMVSETGVSVSQSDSETTLTLEPFWGSQSATFQMAWTNLAAGVYTARVTLDATTAISDTNRVNNVSEFVFAIRDPLSLDDAIGCNGLAFETSEDDWYGTRDGVDQTLSYARTKHLGNYGTNILSATVSDAGTLSFDWKVSSEANYDWLEFLIDGVVTNRISGANGTWQNCSYDFADGEHVVQWRYRKDGSYYGGLDCAWLANIIWTAAQHEPQAVAVPVVGVDGVEVAGETAVFYAESCTVSLVCSTPDAMIYYTTNGSTPRLSDRYKYTGPFTITDTTTIKAIAVLDNMKSEYSTVTIMKRVLALGEAVSANTTGAELMWMTGGDATWMPVVDMTSTTGFSAQSGAIGDATGEDFSTTWLQTEVSGAGTISFRWKVDCEWDDSGDATWDRIMFFTNGVEVARMDGASGWEELAFTFADAGTRTLRWEFVKDDYNEEAFTDRAWVSNFSWSPNNVVSPDPIPPVAMDAAPTVVSAALSGAADSNLTANVTNSAQYAAYRTWALSVTNDTTTAQMIKESTRTWLSFALGADALIDKELTSDDVRIESFAPVSTEGKFEMIVSVKGVNIGRSSVAEEMLKHNLKKVFVVEGASSLTPSVFSSDNITITFDSPVDGKARFAVTPPNDIGSSFFMRVKVK